MFWYSWPSWVVELLGGAVLILVIYWVLRWLTNQRTINLFGPALLGLLVSLVYEIFWDINGWSLKDVAQRFCGMLIGLAISWLLFNKRQLHSEIEISEMAVLKLMAGDVVVYSHPRQLPMQAKESIHQTFRRILPDEVRVLVLDEGAKLSIVRKPGL